MKTARDRDGNQRGNLAFTVIDKFDIAQRAGLQFPLILFINMTRPASLVGLVTEIGIIFFFMEIPLFQISFMRLFIIQNQLSPEVSVFVLHRYEEIVRPFQKDQATQSATSWNTFDGW